MAANVSVQGFTPSGSTQADNPVNMGVNDVGGIARQVKGSTTGVVMVSGEVASGAAQTAYPLNIGVLAGSNNQAVGGNTAGQAFVTTEGQKKTYSLAGVFVPAATATDVLNLAWVSGTVRLLYLQLSGNSSAAGIGSVLLNKLSTANAGGTSTTPTPVPNEATDAAASSVLKVYTANPTVGTVTGAIKAKKIGVTAASGAWEATWDWTRNQDKAPIIKAAAQSWSANRNGEALMGTESMAYSIIWSEE